MGRTIYLAILFASFLIFPVSVALASELQDQAVETVLTFSSIIDEQNIAAAYWSGSELLRQANDEEEWIHETARAQRLLGPVLKRQLRAVRSVESYPGLPDDDYVIVYFEARTYNKKKAAEIFLVHQDGGTLNVCSYSLR